MFAQPYTASELASGEQIVRELHGLKGFEAWAEHLAKHLARVIQIERESCAVVADRHKINRVSGPSRTTAALIASEIRGRQSS